MDLHKHGIETDWHLIMQGSQKVDVNGKIFAEYIKSLFLRYVARVRSEREIEQEEAASLMDDCPVTSPVK